MLIFICSCSVSCGFDDPRSKVTVGDGMEFISSKKEQYDVIIVDSSDPDGPAGTLFGEKFYQAVRSPALLFSIRMVC